ncbi:MAG TPA: LacI family DNA-binding transcriptional regulator [Candidatus Sulfotelmatobacter sp.]|nr:LacI family DNA-binding transcriptional regulator [Candidatus Sulfotelmatobacter sp.]
MIRHKRLADVARLAGVHASTVSRVLNPGTRAMIRPAVAARVLEAAAQVGYRPHALAASLRTQRSSTVGVVIPDLTNPLFAAIVRGIEDALGAAGYTAVLGNSDNEPARARTLLQRMRERRVDGLILATAHREDALIAECRADEIPLVLVNRTVDDRATSAVVVDDAAGIRLAVEHLVGLGHRAIAHLAGPQDLSTGRLRQRSFARAMVAAGLRVDPRLVLVCRSMTEAEGRRQFGQLLTRGAKFTAVLAGNDLIAMGCYDELAARGLACPKAVSIVGYNDLRFVDRMAPPLTTVRIPQYDMGAEAARLLLDRMLDPRAPVRTITLAPELVVRGSTAPIRRQTAADRRREARDRRQRPADRRG